MSNQIRSTEAERKEYELKGEVAVFKCLALMLLGTCIYLYIIYITGGC